MSMLAEESLDGQENHTVFAGRVNILQRLHQRFTNPLNSQAAVVTGRPRIGKTALLLQTKHVFDDSFVTVYVPLKRLPMGHERLWLEQLARIIAEAVRLRGFALHIEAYSGEAEWIAGEFLTEVFRAIRPHRRLTLLLDDTDRLLDAVTSGALRAESIPFLQSLIGPQLNIALTVADSHEDRVGQLQPLVEPTEVLRLTALSEQEITDFVRKISGSAPFSESAAAAIFQATGGEPWLLQPFAAYLRQHVADGQDAVTKAVLQSIYETVEEELRGDWLRLSRDERLVLTALSDLIYDNPLRPVNTERITDWLLGTDYPMDTTTASAAIRSLEYLEIIEGSTSNVTIRAGLRQKWLLENARIDTPAAEITVPSKLSRRRTLALVIAILGFLGLLLIISMSTAPAGDATPVPTITLPPQGS